MKEKFSKNNIISFLIVLTILLIISYRFTQGYAYFDHYRMFGWGYIEYAKKCFFNDGRIFSGIYILIANLLKIRIQDLHIISNIIGLIIVDVNILYFARILRDKINCNKWCGILLSLITIFNFSCVDNMKFIEFPIISIFIHIFCKKDDIR